AGPTSSRRPVVASVLSEMDELADATQLAGRLDKEREAREVIANARERAVQELLSDHSRTLAEIVNSLEETISRAYPKYLRILDRGISAQSDKERLARHLLMHSRALASQTDHSPNVAIRLRDLEKQVNELSCACAPNAH